MKNKERFMRAISRFQNYSSHKDTKNKLLEKAFGEDSMIMDFDGLEEIVDTVIDMTVVMFPNLSEESVRDNIEWYLYEAVNMDDPEVVDGEKSWIVNNSEVLYDMLDYFNSKE